MSSLYLSDPLRGLPAMSPNILPALPSIHELDASLTKPPSPVGDTQYQPSPQWRLPAAPPEFGPSLVQGLTNNEVSSCTFSADKGNSPTPSEQAPYYQLTPLPPAKAITKKRPRTDRQTTAPSPSFSSHCHVCGRSANAVKPVPRRVCTNTGAGCRKVVCAKCFASHGWDWEAAGPGSTWRCCHCENQCPSKARCFIYRSVNSRRSPKSGSVRKSEAIAPSPGSPVSPQSFRM
mmetsp:Transcript_28420/g.69139  ORF Transcript_28420/g.69139 Transcript_28420/m.69139 type:complete len:233 (-) Transcript_28420:1135-1833(-)